MEEAFAPEPQPQMPAMASGMMNPAAGAAPASASQPIQSQPGGMAPAAGSPAKPDIASLLASIGGAA